MAESDYEDKKILRVTIVAILGYIVCIALGISNVILKIINTEFSANFPAYKSHILLGIIILIISFIIDVAMRKVD